MRYPPIGAARGFLEQHASGSGGRVAGGIAWGHRERMGSSFAILDGGRFARRQRRPIGRSPVGPLWGVLRRIVPVGLSCSRLRRNRSVPASPARFRPRCAARLAAARGGRRRAARVRFSGVRFGVRSSPWAHAFSGVRPAVRPARGRAPFRVSRVSRHVRRGLSPCVFIGAASGLSCAGRRLDVPRGLRCAFAPGA